MILHGKIHQASNHRHLKPIAEFVTKGVADARESMVLTPKACDVKGAKRHNGQQCVIAKALTRVMKPDAVAVGRHIAYVVQDGLAVRFKMTAQGTRLVEEFDQRGKAKNLPIKLLPIPMSLKFGTQVQAPDSRARHDQNTKKRRMRKLGVRAIGGGITQ